MKNHQFEICLRLIIIDKNKILLCRDIKNQHYFFPGGHLEFGEDIFGALKREMKEEQGVALLNIDFIGAVDNIYFRKKSKHHEINLVFKGKVSKVHEQSKEKHISFRLFNIKDLPKVEILPENLKKSVIRWLKDKKVFWAGKLK